MTSKASAAAVLTILVALLVGCKTTAAIETPPPVEAAGSLEHTRAAILLGMNAERWEFVGDDGHTIVARLYVSSSRADVAISYDASQITFAYRASDLFSYDPEHGTIHRKYNRRVASLRASIASAVTRVDAGDAPLAAPTP